MLTGEVAFVSEATNLDSGDTDEFGDVYVKDLASGELALASVTSAGTKGNGPSGWLSISISGDGSDRIRLACDEP